MGDVKLLLQRLLKERARGILVHQLIAVIKRFDAVVGLVEDFRQKKNAPIAGSRSGMGLPPVQEDFLRRLKFPPSQKRLGFIQSRLDDGRRGSLGVNIHPIPAVKLPGVRVPVITPISISISQRNRGQTQTD